MITGHSKYMLTDGYKCTKEAQLFSFPHMEMRTSCLYKSKVHRVSFPKAYSKGLAATEMCVILENTGAEKTRGHLHLW